MKTYKYFDDETVQLLKDAAILEDIINDHQTLKAKGTSRVGNCPKCGGDKFTYTQIKDYFKCFKGCEVFGSDALGYLTRAKEMPFLDALNYLADRYKIYPADHEESKPTLSDTTLSRVMPTEPRYKQLMDELEALDPNDPLADNLRYQLNIDKEGNATPAPKHEVNKIKGNFRARQLHDSGISDKAQQWELPTSNGESVIIDRYQSASVDKAFRVIPGNDMVLHYIDLDGKMMTYYKKGSTSTQLPLIRVRWSVPGQHLSRSGEPMKYQSPWGSGSEFWIPNELIKVFKTKASIETLYITEGEKKADAMTLNGMPTLGIMGIHNFTAQNNMPNTLDRILRGCDVKNVVFILDADWRDISEKADPKVAVDNRPRTFYKAVWKFREYCYEYVKSGINLRIFMAAGIDTQFKGMDDLLIGKLKGAGKELVEDFKVAMAGTGSKGQHVEAYNITETSSHAIKDFWHLNKSETFLAHYGDMLKDRVEFKLGNVTWKWNKEEEEFQLAQAIMPSEQFWSIRTVEAKGQSYDKITYRFQNARRFLYNRGFGIDFHRQNEHRFTLIEDMVVKEIDHHFVRRFMIDFVENISEWEVLEMLLRAGHQYLGPMQMANMWERKFNFNASDKNCMYLYFQNKYWKITADNVEEFSIKDLPNPVWDNKIIDFEPNLLPEPLIQVTREDGEWKSVVSKAGKDCDILRFYDLTSNFYWRKLYELEKDEDGTERYVKKPVSDLITQADKENHKESLLMKMVAAGYMAHDYIDYSVTKAVIGMDGLESEVGRSEGGTGKSIFGKQFGHIHPSFIVDGKKAKLEEDNFLLEGVDERTGSIIFDDIKVNFSFEFLFSMITTGITVNPKGGARFNLPPKKTCILTNHALNGEGNSYDRRQYPITFSDYFNGNRTPNDEFGHQLFHEWDWEQWNYFYNFMATCVQHYLRFGLVESQNKEGIKRRKQRQAIGESFLNFCNRVFATGGTEKGCYTNKKVERKYLMRQYADENPRDAKFLDMKRFTEKLIRYCNYANLHYNPTRDGGYVKSGSNYYHVIADDDFNAAMMMPAINDDQDLNRWEEAHNVPF